MTLLEEIADKCSPELIASGEHGTIARIVSEGRTQIISRLGGIGVVMETLGADDGAKVLNKLEALRVTNASIKWGWYLIERGELDFGATVTREMIDMLEAGGVISKANAAALRGIAVVPAPVSVQEVIQAMEGL